MLRLKTTRALAAAAMESIQNERFLSALPDHWTVTEEGFVKAQSVCWFYCWAVTGDGSEETASRARQVFDEIMPASYMDFSGWVPHRWAQDHRYLETDLEGELRTFLPEHLYEAFEKYTDAKQGYSRNTVIRQKIEKYSMNQAKAYYLRIGFNVVKDVSATESYDLLCTATGQTKYVEVKGTRSSGIELLFTRNEVDLASSDELQMELFISHSIVLDGEEVRSSVDEIVPNWNPDRLGCGKKATQYLVDVSALQRQRA